MPRRRTPFAVYKPALGAQENKCQDQNAEHVPLPRVPGVGPKKTLLNESQNEVHHLSFADTYIRKQLVNRNRRYWPLILIAAENSVNE
jgi:hypothetical protein